MLILTVWWKLGRCNLCFPNFHNCCGILGISYQWYGKAFGNCKTGMVMSLISWTRFRGEVICPGVCTQLAHLNPKPMASPQPSKLTELQKERTSSRDCPTWLPGKTRVALILEYVSLGEVLKPAHSAGDQVLTTSFDLFVETRDGVFVFAFLYQETQ